MEQFIKETGIIQTPFYMVNPENKQPYFCYFGTVDYTKVFWHDGFKFVIGKRRDDTRITQIIEVSTGARCVGSDEVLRGKGTLEERMYYTFLCKLKEKNVCVGELVDRFNSKNNAVISAWENSLML